MRIPQPINDFVMLLFLPGILLHESTHWILGWIAGGNPEFSEKRFRVPTQVDFNSPGQMSDLGIQITGGAVTIYPIIFVGVVSFHLKNLSELLRLINFLTIYLSLGAIGVSWLDIMAAQDPQRWVRYTSGKPISRED